jgi:hypothetical protein
LFQATPTLNEIKIGFISGGNMFAKAAEFGLPHEGLSVTVKIFSPGLDSDRVRWNVDHQSIAKWCGSTLDSIKTSFFAQSD